MKFLKGLIILCLLLVTLSVIYQEFIPTPIFAHLVSSKVSPKGNIVASYVDDEGEIGFGGGIIPNAIVLSSGKQKALAAYTTGRMFKAQIIYYAIMNTSAPVKDYKWLSDYELGVYLVCGSVQNLRSWYYGAVNDKRVEVKIKYFFPKNCPKETNTNFVQYGY